MSNGRKSKGTGILAFIFLLPLIAIIFFAIKYSSQTIVIDNVTRVTLSAPDRDRVSLDSQEDIEFFVNMLESCLSINKEMRDVSGETPVSIVFDREDKSVEYKLYPSLNLSGCLLVAPDGKLYVLENEKAKNLLLRPEFDYLYSAYFLPALNVVSGNSSVAAKPFESTWTYFKSDGVEYSYTPEYATGDEIYTIFKGMENSLSFSHIPEDDTSPEITDLSFVAENGTEYNINDISELDLSTDTVINVSLTANWSSRSGARAYGEAKYNFKIMYDIPATLEFQGGDYTIGDVIVVNASHLNPDEKVNFESLLDIPRVEFGMVGEDKGVALLPIGLSASPGKHTVKLSNSGNSINENLVISPVGDSQWKTVEVPTEEYKARLTPEKIRIFHEYLQGLTETRPETDYFVYGTDEFAQPVSGDPAVYFGGRVNLGVVESEKGDTGERISEGLIYELGEGTTVRAVQSGEVVFSGELAPTGNTVVIYHGYGVYSYYFHLAELNDIREGRIYNKNETVGIAGTSGYTGGKNILNFAMSIDGVFVNPQWFISE